MLYQCYTSVCVFERETGQDREGDDVCVSENEMEGVLCCQSVLNLPVLLPE